MQPVEPQHHEGSGPAATATVAALMRAAHLHLDQPPPIFADAFAMPLCGLSTLEQLRARLAAFEELVTSHAGQAAAGRVLRYLRAVMVMRSRYVEDQLDRAVAEGTGQCVILGAGLDALAYRRQDRGEQLAIYEVDLPSVQLLKQERLRAAGLEVPRNVTFVPVDFERQPLLAALAGAGLQLRHPVFVSWLGVTQYLTPEAVSATLRSLAGAAPGSRIVLEYQLPKSSLHGAHLETMQIVLDLVANVARQPWRTFFETEALEQLLRSLGYSAVMPLDPTRAAACYFAERRDGLEYPYPSCLLEATV